VISVEGTDVSEEGSTVPLPSGAVVTLYPNGTFVYDPNGAFDSLAEGETVEDCFEYVISDDSGGTDTGTVCIKVEGKNDVVAEDDSYTTDADVPITEQIVRNDSDPEGDDFSVSEVDPEGDGTFVPVDAGGVTFAAAKTSDSEAGGVVTLYPDGTMTFDPSGDFGDLDTDETESVVFPYVVEDTKGAVDTATVSILIVGIDEPTSTPSFAPSISPSTNPSNNPSQHPVRQPAFMKMFPTLLFPSLSPASLLEPTASFPSLLPTLLPSRPTCQPIPKPFCPLSPLSFSGESGYSSDNDSTVFVVTSGKSGSKVKDGFSGKGGSMVKDASKEIYGSKSKTGLGYSCACDGKMRSVTLRYSGNSYVSAVATDKSGNSLLMAGSYDDIYDGSLITVILKGEDYLSMFDKNKGFTEIKFVACMVNEQCDTWDLHTSCSQNLFGHLLQKVASKGYFTVVEYVDGDGNRCPGVGAFPSSTRCPPSNRFSPVSSLRYDGQVVSVIKDGSKGKGEGSKVKGGSKGTGISFVKDGSKTINSDDMATFFGDDDVSVGMTSGFSASKGLVSKTSKSKMSKSKVLSGSSFIYGNTRFNPRCSPWQWTYISGIDYISNSKSKGKGKGSKSKEGSKAMQGFLSKDGTVRNLFSWYGEHSGFGSKSKSVGTSKMGYKSKLPNSKSSYRRPSYVCAPISLAFATYSTKSKVNSISGKGSKAKDGILSDTVINSKGTKLASKNKSGSKSGVGERLCWCEGFIRGYTVQYNGNSPPERIVVTDSSSSTIYNAPAVNASRTISVSLTEPYPDVTYINDGVKRVEIRTDCSVNIIGGIGDGTLFSVLGFMDEFGNICDGDCEDPVEEECVLIDDDCEEPAVDECIVDIIDDDCIDNSLVSAPSSVGVISRNYINDAPKATSGNVNEVSKAKISSKSIYGTKVTGTKVDSKSMWGGESLWNFEFGSKSGLNDLPIIASLGEDPGSVTPDCTSNVLIDSTYGCSIDTPFSDIPIKIVSADDDTVQFKLLQYFKCSSSDDMVDWIGTEYEHEDSMRCESVSDQLCSFGGQEIATYIASCHEKVAQVDIFVSNQDDFTVAGERIMPPIWCDSKTSMEYCRFTFMLSCDSKCGRRKLENKKLDVREDTPGSPEKRACRDDSVATVKPIPVDNCISRDSSLPFTILSRDFDSVTFTLLQGWKGCGDEKEKLSWMAVDYVVLGGELQCFSIQDVGCGSVSTISAQCTEGSTIVDVYVQDDSQLGLFDQLGGSPLIVPEACSSSGHKHKACHFRYVLDCKESCSDVLGNLHDISGYLRREHM